jgi:hypothetical protein
MTPTIADARAFAQQHRQSGVLIVSIADGHFVVTSYGADRRRCRALAKLTDFIAEALNAGKVDLSAFQQGPST